MSRAEDIFEKLIYFGEDAIDEFILNRQTEELVMDFKQAASDGKSMRSLHPNDRRNLAKAISAFGNSEGGVLVWGVECAKDVEVGDVVLKNISFSAYSNYKNTRDKGYVVNEYVLENFNNDKLVSQKVYFGNDYLPTKVEVIDGDGNVHIKMKYNKIDMKTEFNDTYFDLNSILDTENIGDDKDNINSETQEPGNESSDEKTKETATIEDIIYPMYLPANTYLTNQEKVSTDEGERLILTFTGDSSFTLVEETVSYSSRPEIIPTYGDVELIGNSLAVINDNSANWFDNGIEYYVVSDVMSTEELLQVVKSISVLPVSK